jgi:hypothetical protein
MVFPDITIEQYFLHAGYPAQGKYHPDRANRHDRRLQAPRQRIKDNGKNGPAILLTKTDTAYRL